jgi:hypothetical protein
MGHINFLLGLFYPSNHRELVPTFVYTAGTALAFAKKVLEIINCLRTLPAMVRSVLPIIVFSNLLFICPVDLNGQLEDWDSDRDAMPNAWEYHRNLDENDPKDAWLDPDQDGVCNLYEYYLGSHPQVPDQPLVLDYRGDQSLETFIRMAPRGSVLRIPEGEYDLNYRHEAYAESPRVLIQGGWKADFSERDHCRYKTILNGNGKNPVFHYFISSGNSSSLILDGFILQGGKGEAVQYTSYLSKAQLLIANTTFIGNQAGRTSAVVKYVDGDFTLISDVILINSTIAHNAGTGLLVSQQANLSNLKVLHSLIAYNAAATSDSEPIESGYGMVYSSGADSLVHVQMANSILWGNANADVWFDDPDRKRVLVNSRYNVYGYIEQDSLSAPFAHQSDTGLDPLVMQRGEQYFLGPNSPARGSGRSIGFTEEERPDVGIVPCGDPVVSAPPQPEKTTSDWRVFPNPAHTSLTFELDLIAPGEVQIVFYDLTGRRVLHKRIGYLSSGPQSFRVDISHLQSKLYWLEVRSGGQSLNRPYKLIKGL